MKEINALRTEYQEAYNKKDTKALTSMYASDAMAIMADGTMLMGRTAIGKALADAAPSWSSITITSDSVRVVGHTAWDVGTASTTGADGAPMVSRYLVVLRRGLKEWQLASAANVPETHAAAASH